MNISLTRARKLARSLLRENRNGRPWRKIAEEDYGNRVHYATLNRFAKSKGEWTPKEDSLLIALGLKKPYNPLSRLPKWFEKTEQALQWFDNKRKTVKEMNKDTREALNKR